MLTALPPSLALPPPTTTHTHTNKHIPSLAAGRAHPLRFCFCARPPHRTGNGSYNNEKTSFDALAHSGDTTFYGETHNRGWHKDAAVHAQQGSAYVPPSLATRRRQSTQVSTVGHGMGHTERHVPHSVSAYPNYWTQAAQANIEQVSDF